MSLRGLQTYREIDWRNPITKGLRHIIVPNVQGLGDNGGTVIRESQLARNGSWYLRAVEGTTYQHSIPQQKPNMVVISNSYVNTTWRLTGPQLVWNYDRDMSVLCRSITWGAETSPRAIWGISGYPNPGWEMIVYGASANGIFGQFGIWAVGYLNSYSVIDPSAALNQNFGTGIFVWDGVGKRYYASLNGVWSGWQPFTGAAGWPPVGGGSDFTQYTEWGMRAVDATPTTILSHMYMWERALQPSEAIRLGRDPGIIFGAASQALSMQSTETGGSIPPVVDNSSDNQHHAIA